jgi:hypothetical protein
MTLHLLLSTDPQVSLPVTAIPPRTTQGCTDPPCRCCGGPSLSRFQLGPTPLFGVARKECPHCTRLRVPWSSWTRFSSADSCVEKRLQPARSAALVLVDATCAQRITLRGLCELPQVRVHAIEVQVGNNGVQTQFLPRAYRPVTLTGPATLVREPEDAVHGKTASAVQRADNAHGPGHFTCSALQSTARGAART